MIHFNDTHSGLGSRHDRHAHLGEGRIGAAGMAHLLRHPALDHVAFYLETPGMEDGFDAVNMARLSDLVAGRPLTQAPDRIDEGAAEAVGGGVQAAQASRAAGGGARAAQASPAAGVE